MQLKPTQTRALAAMSRTRAYNTLEIIFLIDSCNYLLLNKYLEDLVKKGLVRRKRGRNRDGHKYLLR